MLCPSSTACLNRFSRETSASEYKRVPPSVRNGRIAPYRRSQTRTTSTDNPVNRVTAPIMYFGFDVACFFPAMCAHFQVSSRFCQDNLPDTALNPREFLVIILTRLFLLAILPFNQASARRCKNENTYQR